MNKEFQKKLNELSKLSGYEKPKKISGSLKLDSNENFVIGKQFQLELINAAKKRCDIREYPLGGTEKLIANLPKYLKVPSNMVGVGNGSDQILDLFLANFCTRKTRILTSEPTFAFFEERCKLYGVKMIKVQFSDGMTLDVDQFLSKSKNAVLPLQASSLPATFASAVTSRKTPSSLCSNTFEFRVLTNKSSQPSLS